MPQNTMVNVQTEKFEIKAKKFVGGTNEIEDWTRNSS